MQLTLSARQLQGLKAYKYKAGGYTVLDDLHNPIWTWLVNRLPMWLAPNLITLAAASCIFAAYALNAYYLPDFTGDAPRWVYVLTGLSVVAYVNLDCMDGKQARRTGSSSPLGQLFDHGLDALVLHMMLGNIAASLGVPCGLKMAAGCMGIMAPWILAQWEEYHTGVMVYGTKYYGVMEANYSICLVHLLTACLGPSMWRMRVPLPLPGLLGTDASLADLSLIGVSAAGVAQALHNVQRVLFTSPSKPAPSGTSSPANLSPPATSSLPADEAGDKDLGRGAAVRHLAGLLAALALGAALLHAAQGQGALHARLTFCTFGVSYSLMASQLIIAHMCKSALSPPWLVGALLSSGAAAGTLLHPSTATSWPPIRLPFTPIPVVIAPTTAAAAVLAAVTTLCYLTYVLSVIDQICEFLGIRVLTISPAPRPAASAAAAAAAAVPAAEAKQQQATPGSGEPHVASPGRGSCSSETGSGSDDDLADAVSVIPVAAAPAAAGAGAGAVRSRKVAAAAAVGGDGLSAPAATK